MMKIFKKDYFALCLTIICFNGIVFSESLFKNVVVKNRVNEPKTIIKVWPHTKKNIVTFEILSENYPLDGESPGITLKARQYIKREDRLTVENMMNTIEGKKIEPILEKFEINGLNAEAKFSIVSWVENIQELSEEHEKKHIKRIVYPSIMLVYNNDNKKQIGTIESLVTIRQSDIIYKIKRGSFWFPFEKSEIKVGFYNIKGVVDIAFNPIKHLRTYLKSEFLESVYPNKNVPINYEQINSENELTASTKIPAQNIFFFSGSYNRNSYQIIMILLIYLCAVFFAYEKRNEKYPLYGISVGLGQFLLSTVVFGKENFAATDFIFLILLIVFYRIKDKRKEWQKEGKRFRDRLGIWHFGNYETRVKR